MSGPVVHLLTERRFSAGWRMSCVSKDPGRSLPLRGPTAAGASRRLKYCTCPDFGRTAIFADGTACPGSCAVRCCAGFFALS
jgi:hypothetical protein